MQHWLDYRPNSMGKAKTPNEWEVPNAVFPNTPKKILSPQDAARLQQLDQTTDPLQKVYREATWIHDLLLRVGLGEPAASYATYATYHETAAYKNNGATSYNNWSGIKYAGQKGAKKGPNGYAIFTTPTEWAQAYKHELTKGTNPAGAKTLEEFVKRLKANRYFTDNEVSYLSGLKRARLVLKVIPSEVRSGPNQQRQDLDIPGSIDYSQKKESWFKKHPVATGAMLAAAGVIIIKMVND